MHGFILAVCLHRGAVCNILALSLLTAYRVVLAAALFSVAWHITYLCFGGRWRCCCLRVFCICLLSCVLLCVCVPFHRGWGAHKSLAPGARTLPGVLGQATRNAQFLRRRDPVVLLFFVSVLNFATSPNSGVKLFSEFLRSEKTICRVFFSGCASSSWFFILFCCDRATVGSVSSAGAGSLCVCVRAPPVSRHSWLGCAVWVCALGLGLWLRPATPGWGVPGSVCIGVPAPPVPRHSWLGCAVWVGVLGSGFWLRPATPGWGVGVCVCFCAPSTRTPPILALVCGVGVCAWAQVSAAPRHLWLGCSGSVCFCVRTSPVPRHP